MILSSLSTQIPKGPSKRAIEICPSVDPDLFNVPIVVIIPFDIF